MATPYAVPHPTTEPQAGLYMIWKMDVGAVNYSQHSTMKFDNVFESLKLFMFDFIQNLLNLSNVQSLIGFLIF